MDKRYSFAPKSTYISTKTEVGLEGSPYMQVLQYLHGSTAVFAYEDCSTLLITLNEDCNLFNLEYISSINNIGK